MVQYTTETREPPVEQIGEADPDYEKKRRADIENLECHDRKAPEEIEELYRTWEYEDLVEELEENPPKPLTDLNVY